MQQFSSDECRNREETIQSSQAIVLKNACSELLRTVGPILRIFDFFGVSLRELLQMFATYLSQDLLGLFGSDSSQIVTLPFITVHYLYVPITSIHIHMVIHGHVWDMLGYIRHVQGTIWRATRLPDSSDIRLNGRAV